MRYVCLLLLLIVLALVPTAHAGEKFNGKVVKVVSEVQTQEVAEQAHAGVLSLTGTPFYWKEGAHTNQWTQYAVAVQVPHQRIVVWCNECDVPQEGTAVQLEMSGDKATLRWSLFGKSKQSKLRLLQVERD